MFRTMMISAAAALGLATAASAQVFFPQTPVPIQRRPPIVVPPRINFHTVYFQRFAWEPWNVYTVTYDHDSAMRHARFLRSQGFRVFVRH